MIVVIVTARARDGHEAEVQDALLEAARLTRAEPGCVQYDLHVGAEDPALVAVYERWADQAALDAHYQTPHARALHAKGRELLDGKPSMVAYALLEAEQDARA